MHLCSTDKTAPNVAFEYGGDGNGEEVIKEIEIEEKKHLLDSAVSATFARFCTHSECTVKFNVPLLLCPSVVLQSMRKEHYWQQGCASVYLSAESPSSNHQSYLRRQRKWILQGYVSPIHSPTPCNRE